MSGVVNVVMWILAFSIAAYIFRRKNPGLPKGWHKGPQRVCPACGVADLFVCNQCAAVSGVHYQSDPDFVPGSGTNKHNCARYQNYGTYVFQQKLSHVAFCTSDECPVIGEHLHQSCLACKAAWICAPKNKVS